MGRLKRLKKIRIHREGTHTLAGSLVLILAVNTALYFGLECKVPFYVVAVISLIVYGILVNFFRCPIRLFGQETEKVVVAPADGKIVVVEEVEENEYFHEGCRWHERNLPQPVGEESGCEEYPAQRVSVGTGSYY